ncbi:MAG: hypothetical protein RLZZ281_993, partial [Pseudomonadota bacterium]
MDKTVKPVSQPDRQRRSLMEYALKGGVAAGAANMTIMTDVFAQASGPLVIGHHV